MAKYMIFNKDINYQTVLDLIHDMDEHLENSEEEIELNWESGGGSVSAMNILLKYVNDYPLKITINAIGGCESCGLMFLILAKRTVNVFPTAYGMFHNASTMLRSIEMTDKKSCSHIRYEQVEKINDSYFEIYKEMGLSDEDLALIKKGDDVNFSAEDMVSYITIYNAKKDIKEIDFKVVEVEKKVTVLEYDKRAIQKRMIRAVNKLAKKETIHV